MKKSILSLAFLALLSTTPNTIQPIPSKIVLPVGAALAAVGSIATLYCYKQEKSLLEELEKLELTAAEIENAVIQTTPAEIAALKELVEQRRVRFAKGKWACAGVTMASLLAAIISGVKMYRSSGEQQPPPPPGLTQEEISRARKLILNEKVVQGVPVYLELNNAIDDQRNLAEQVTNQLDEMLARAANMRNDLIATYEEIDTIPYENEHDSEVNALRIHLQPAQPDNPEGNEGQDD